MNPSVTLSARDYASATSLRKSAADFHTANTSSQAQLEPASSEVISNLIISLSIMPTTPSKRSPSTSPSVGASSSSFRNLKSDYQVDTHSQYSGNREKDFDVNKYSIDCHSPLDQTLDKLTKSPPTVRTAKSTSILSGLTRPEPPLFSPFTTNSHFRTNSRPVSGKSDIIERRSIGNLSISPVHASFEVNRKSSDDWGKRQRRINCKSSVERLQGHDSWKKLYSKDSGMYMSERPYSKQNHRSSISPTPSRTAGNSRLSHNERISVDGRSSSIGSIDEAVEAYLYAPRLSQKIRHPQTGRLISFSEVGDPEGFAVFCCVGMGLTRYVTAFYDELALSLKLRLITPDRPGVGDSEPYNDGTSTPLSWPDDVYTICQCLRITKFSILAHSAGAIYALATALRMPQHIRGRIHLLAPWIPPSQMSVIGGRMGLPPNNSIPTSQRILRVLPTTILKAANSSFISATSNSLTSSLPKQRKSKRKSVSREVLAASTRNILAAGIEKEIMRRNSLLFLESADETINHIEDSQLNSEAEILAAAAYSLAVKERKVNYESRLTHAIWDLATQGANPAVDLLVCLERRHTIGFRYVDITRSVVIHHGSKDTRVPLENVLWMGKTMKRCEVHVLEGEGHSLMASASVMSSILTEIAKEWEEWMRVTTSTVAHRNESIRRTLLERASIGAFR